MLEMSVREDGQIILVGENSWGDLFQVFLYCENGRWEFETYDQYMNYIMRSSRVELLAH